MFFSAFLTVSVIRLSRVSCRLAFNIHSKIPYIINHADFTTVPFLSSYFRQSCLVFACIAFIPL